jgi:translation initiation factor IF-3
MFAHMPNVFKNAIAATLSQVRLIDEDGQQIGIVETTVAMQIAAGKGLDLHLIQPEANPPVAKIMDYGRFRFEEHKRVHQDRQKHPISDVKQIKMRYIIDPHDYEVKLRQGSQFLSNHDRIKLIVALRGREVRHADLAIVLARQFADDLHDLCIVEQEPILEGRSIIMKLSPKPRGS